MLRQALLPEGHLAVPALAIGFKSQVWVVPWTLATVGVETAVRDSRVICRAPGETGLF